VLTGVARPVPGPADPVAAHVAALARSLYGPSTLRRSMLREARDGLDDAVAAYRDAGVDPGRAAELAVRDFGPIAAIAPRYQDELAAGQGRRTALLLAVAFPALMLGWDLVWSTGAAWGDATPTVRTLSVVQDASSVGIAVLALVLLVLGLRRTADPRRLVRATGRTALVAALLSGGTAVAMNVADPGDAWALLATRPAFAAAYLTSVVALALVGASARRAVRVARHRTEVAP
jgi:hypothetical protein